MNRTQTRQLFGWSSADFDAAVARGFPATKPDPSRGRDWRIDSKAAIAWVVEQEAGKARPEPVDQDERPPAPPPGLAAVDGLENPIDQGAVLAHLTTVDALPTQVAAFAVLEAGLPMDTAFRLSAGITALVCHGFAAELGSSLEPWRSSERPDVYEAEGFDLVNWPALAAEAGEPGWTPPCCGFGWVEGVPDCGARAAARGHRRP